MIMYMCKYIPSFTLLICTILCRYMYHTSALVHMARTSAYLQYRPFAPSHPAVPVDPPHLTLVDLIIMNSCITM